VKSFQNHAGMYGNEILEAAKDLKKQASVSPPGFRYRNPGYRGVSETNYP